MGIIESTPESAEGRTSWLPWAVAAVFCVVSASLMFVHFRETPAEALLMTMSLNPPEGTNFDFAGFSSPPALSPDGRRIVIRARGADGKT